MTQSGFLGSNISLVKEHNLRAILLSLLSDGPLSRIQLADKTSLSATTMTNLVDELAGRGIIRACRDTECRDAHRVGRPRAKLRLVKHARLAIGVHMRVGVYRVGLVNLLGELVDYVEAEFNSETPAHRIIDDIARDVEVLTRRNRVGRSKILGVGLGASGLVNYSTGVNVLSANFGWHDVPMREWLGDQLRLPIVVDNNVRCMAMGEALFGAGRGVRSLVFVYGRFGVGAGIVVDHRVFRGSGLGAGEIGHTIVMPSDGPLCRCGQHGCLESLIAEPALVRQAEQLVQQHPESLLASRLCAPDRGRPIKALFLAARDGDPWARGLVETGARYLGTALANLVNLINPELILLGGLFAEEESIILPIARATMEASAFGGLGRQARLQATSFGWQAGMVGAGTLALAKFFYLNPEEV